jgi:heme/copper-type cytochrome/quinol oxidase subunit 2
MIQKIRNILISLAFVGAVATPLATPALASAAGLANNQIAGGVCAGTSLQNLNFDSGGSTAQCKKTDANQQLNHIIKLVINIFSIVVGVVAVIMIIVGGFKYIVSNGESSAISSAKNTIIYAIIGLIIVALAQFIVHFVLGNVLGAGGVLTLF